MKIFTLLLLTFVLSPTLNYTNAQCPPGDVILNSQTEVSDFVASYPNCTEISGTLKIGSIAFGSYSNIYDVSGLEGINTVTGDLLITANNNLTSIHGLDQLRHVGGNVHIFYNQNLTNLGGLGKLETVNGNLKIINNQSLTTVGGMQNLISVGADVEVSENAALLNLNAFGKLTTIGGYFSIWGNSSLGSVGELTKLGAVGGNLSINQNYLIQNLHGLESLVTLGGDFNITQNVSLTEIGDLSPIMQPSAVLRIAFNFNLSECAVEVFCTHISNEGGTEIIGNGEGCSSIIEIEGSCASTLPVELVGFRAEVKNKNVLLTWQTLTENNNEGFEIQRSNNANDWQTIGWEAGQGDATTTQTYTFTDSRPVLGKSYYRLMQVDFDGKAEFSEIVTVAFYNGVVSVYPNPVSNVLKIAVADEMPIESVIVYNTSGSEVMRTTALTNSLNVSQLNPGTYIIAVQVDGETTRQKLVVE